MSQFFASGGQSIGVSPSSFDSILTIKLKPFIQEQGGGSDDPLQVRDWNISPQWNVTQ